MSSLSTGSVAGALNVLVERLGQIMQVVSGVAGEVNQGTQMLDQLATAVVTNAQRQIQSVEQVQGLMDKIGLLSDQAVQQTATADAAIQSAQTAVNQGQQDIFEMSSNLGTLRQGAEQIIRRVQTLTDYVDLATQFAKDQRRVASMTRVLALNASMLSTRATEQKDPDQFASVTREFETVTAQVNDLASQTNQGLALLKQRTDQIQTVVSGLSHDIQEMSQQVDSFTAGVEQSANVFSHIDVATDQVACLGQEITQSSQTIAKATQAALQAVNSITEITTETLQHANLTLEQSEQLVQVGQTLDDNIDFFQLPELTQSRVVESSSESLKPAQSVSEG